MNKEHNILMMTTTMDDGIDRRSIGHGRHR